MNRAKAKTNRPAPASAGVSLISPPGAAAAPLIPPSPSKHVTLSTSSQYAPPGFTCPPKAGSARARSSTNTDKHRLIICGLSSIQSEVIAHLSRQADSAYYLRQIDKVDAIGRQLEEIHAPIASYYRGLAAQRYGAGNLDQARRLLEQAVNYAPRNYQARALFILGSIAEYRRDYKAESEFYRLALSLNQSDLFTAVETRRALAIRASSGGDHRSAIHILENLLHLASKHPYLHAQVLNSLAVEYHQAGRLQEALRLAQIVCASPLATIYHEFGETRKEIQEDLRERELRAEYFIAHKIDASAERGIPEPHAAISDERATTTLKPSREAASLDPRPKRRRARRINQVNYVLDLPSLDSASSSKEPIARNVEASCYVINRVKLSAPIHAPPSISVA
jgi:tetratricopeptide (TPR) repeat protein